MPETRGASALGFLLVLAACSPASGGAGGDDASAAPGDGGLTYAPTYSAVYEEVLAPNCALVFCHGGTADYMQLGTEADGYPSLVRAAAQGPMCAPTGLARVAPGDPDRSLVFLKVTTPPCGARMPIGLYGSMISPRQIQQIAQWIACGALPGDAGCPADAASFAYDGALSSGPAASEDGAVDAGAE